MSIILGIALLVGWVALAAWICLKPRPSLTESAWGYFFGSWQR